MRWSQGLGVAAGRCTCTLLLWLCADAGAATISGHLSRVAGGSPIAAAPVIALRSSDLEPETQSLSVADGSYSLTVPAGTYLIYAGPSGFVPELYDDVPCTDVECEVAQATPITVVAGDNRANIDFALANIGSVAGRVRRSGTLVALEGVRVAVENTSGNEVGSGHTDANGIYSIDVFDGAYRVRTDAGTNVLDEYYDNLPCPLHRCDPSTAAIVNVTSGAHVAGIDFDLDPGGAIAGTLRRASDNTPLPVGCSIEIFDVAGLSLLTFQTLTSDYITPLGLPSGSYRVVARPQAIFLPKIYNNHACGGTDGTVCDPAAGDVVMVTAGTTTGGVDFALLRNTATISGRITALAGGAPLANMPVRARREGTGAIVETTSQANGSFSINVPPGDYTVRAFPAPPLIEEAYPGVQCPGIAGCGGTPEIITLAPEDLRSGIDFALAPLGTLTVGVRDSDSGALLAADLRALLPGQTNAAQFFSDAGGTATIPVPSGGAVRFAARNNGGGCGPEPLRECLGERYPDDPCPGLQCDLANGGAVTVGKGQQVTGIELTLGPGAEIDGTVTASIGGAPIAASTLEVLDANNIAVGGGFTDADGHYRATGLGTGPYFVRTAFTTGFLDELYDNVPCAGGACSPVQGMAISPSAAGVVSGIDFALLAGASIAGRVRADNFGPGISGATVTVFNATGMQVGSTSTAPDGSYVTRTLAAGNYFVRFEASGFDAEIYSNLPCTATSCDPLSGTAIVLAPPNNVAGIDADLSGDTAPVHNPKLVYINSCKPNGCVVHRGLENAITQTSSIVPGTRTLPAFPFSDQAFNDVVQCVRATFAPFFVDITTTDPGNVPHRELILSTFPSTIGLGSEVGGVAPWACGVPIENSIAFTFASQYGEDALAEICSTTAHEIGHQFGLDHEFYCPDHMTYLQGCGIKSFPDFDAQCGTFAPAACYCGSGSSQNTFRKLGTVVGINPAIFGDGFEGLATAPKSLPLGPSPVMPMSCGTDTARANSFTPIPGLGSELAPHER